MQVFFQLLLNYDHFRTVVENFLILSKLIVDQSEEASATLDMFIYDFLLKSRYIAILMHILIISTLSV